jgi:Holliday junction resolvase
MNSRSKGKRGELEFAHYLQAAGYPARRGQQFSGGKESPDVICPALPDIHWEVKRTEAGNPYKWMAQAIRDAGRSKIPVVAHRRNGGEWLAIMPMAHLLSILEDGPLHDPNFEQFSESPSEKPTSTTTNKKDT